MMEEREILGGERQLPAGRVGSCWGQAGCQDRACCRQTERGGKCLCGVLWWWWEGVWHPAPVGALPMMMASAWGGPRVRRDGEWEFFFPRSADAPGFGVLETSCGAGWFLPFPLASWVHLGD